MLLTNVFFLLFLKLKVSHELCVYSVFVTGFLHYLIFLVIFAYFSA